MPGLIASGAYRNCINSESQWLGFRIFFVTLQKIGKMASELEHAVDILTERVKRLIARQDTLLQELATLEDRLTTMEAASGRLRAELTAMSTNCEFLAMSHRLASSPDQLMRTRRLIAKMIRNIDRTIDDLK